MVGIRRAIRPPNAGTLTVSGLADRFVAEHVEHKCKPGTATFYRHIIELRPNHQRPRCCAAEPRVNPGQPLHSITSLARQAASAGS